MRDIFTAIKERFEKKGGDATVTKRTLSLGAADATTGIFPKSFSESSDEVIIISHGNQEILTGTGRSVKTDFMGVTKTEYKSGDEIRNSENHFFKVLATRAWKWLGILRWHELDLVRYLTKNVFLKGHCINQESASDGWIVVNSIAHLLPKTILLADGEYTISFYPPSGDYTFTNWVVIGNLAVIDEYGSSTTLTVSGKGTLIVNYSYSPC